jgi:hypothetical protein
MLNFGEPIKYKAKYKRTDGKIVSSTLTCINEIEAENILKEIPEILFLEMISCKKLDDCDDCKL